MEAFPKTLVIFDTNQIRETIMGGVDYGSFELSSGFKEISDFISKNLLDEYIHLAITDLSINELLKQKIRQFEEDKKNLQGIFARLTSLPNVKIISKNIPDKHFEFEAYLKKQLEDFLGKNTVKILSLHEKMHSDVFIKTIERVLSNKPPFSGDNDRGFKDVIIWETILNFEKINDYDKVIFVSNDQIFTKGGSCFSEFHAKFSKDILIRSSCEMVLQDIKSIYENLIKKIKVVKFTETDYFHDYLDKWLSDLEYINSNWEKYNIVDRKVIEYCRDLKLQNDEESDTSAIIVSKIEIIAHTGKIRKEFTCNLITELDDTMAFIDTYLEEE